MVDVHALFDWLVDGAPGAPTPVHVVQRVGDDLLAAGVPLCRAEAFVRTLHPHIVGRSFLWEPGKAVVVSEQTYQYLESPEFREGPVGRVFETGHEVRRRTTDPSALEDMPALREFAAQGITDFYAGPLRFMIGQVHAITFATRDPQGFREEHLDAARHVLRPLSRVGEVFALLRTATNLLDTYVGHGTGERIMGGQIVRGETATLHAVLWFSDLRGFTALSAQVAPSDIVHTLNDLFDCQVPAIERHGGEVLKFMGDGLLAIFPLDGAREPVAAVCDRALAAADEAFAALERVNKLRARRAASSVSPAPGAAEALAVATDPGVPAIVGGSPILFGLALHVGDVAYGNIGGANRLDFTCIGPAVNLAARLEGLAGRLGHRMVVSEDFARECTRTMQSLGTFELKGVPEPIAAFAPSTAAEPEPQRGG